MASASTADRRLPTIVLVSVTVLLAVAGWIAVGFYVRHRFLTQPYVFRFGAANRLWNGEIVFQEQRLHPISGVGSASRVMTMNSQTGAVRQVNVDVPANLFGCVVDDQRLWIVGQNDIVMTDGTTATPYHPQLPLTPTCIPFLLGGQLTTIVTVDDESSHLVSLVDGEWQRGRRIVLPGSGRSWEIDEDQNRERLVPRTSHSGPSATSGRAFTFVTPIGDDVHTVSIDGTGNSMGYRRGFDFVDEEGDLASALVPENSPADATGWSRLDLRRFGFQTVPGNMHGEFVLATPGPTVLWKSELSDQHSFVRAGAQPDYQFQFCSPVTSADGAEFYLVGSSKFQTFTVFRLTGDHFEQGPASPGNAEKLIALEAITVGLSLGALVLSQVLLLAGAAWLADRWGMNTYSFGHETVSLGPLVRRWAARATDLLCAMCPLLVVCLNSVSAMPAESLIDNQAYIVDHLHQSDRLAAWLPAISGPIAWASVWLVGFPILCMLMQGLSGATLGKWLFGLRVVQTTLRPCGLVRSLLRELLLIVDTLLLLTPIPGVMAILLTDQRRRLGDLTADTLVIDARRLSPPHDSNLSDSAPQVLEGSAL